MLVFLDTEFTDFIDCELISTGIIGEDGQYVLYLEVLDLDHLKCNAFDQSAVWSQLGRIDDAIVRKADLPTHLRDWCTTLPRSMTATYWPTRWMANGLQTSPAGSTFGRRWAQGR